MKQARAQREPWLLAAAPSLANLTALQIINHFATRMQIEEAFRDLKCARYGLGFELNLSRSRERLAALLRCSPHAARHTWICPSRGRPGNHEPTLEVIGARTFSKA